MNRAQYIMLRADWKVSYAQLTIAIRTAKAKKIEAARAWSKFGGLIYYTRNMSANELERYEQSKVLADEFYKCLQHRHELRMKANEMLAELSALKIAAHNAYLAAK